MQNGSDIYGFKRVMKYEFHSKIITIYCCLNDNKHNI
nr:MAG TPA: hypothetical protein [Caudoviricetes sp.]